jgi:hypothetical protein
MGYILVQYAALTALGFSVRTEQRSASTWVSSCLDVSIAQQTEHLITTNGSNIPQLFSRRLEVFTEAGLRDCLMTAQVIPAVMGRMNCAAGYDWAAPAAQSAGSLAVCLSAMVRLMSVNLLVYCFVIRNKLGEKAI